jgi:Fe2+ transport system protein B
MPDSHDPAGQHGAATAEKPLVVALLGNPNTGKSTLFTAVAGIPTRIGNFPGVTVEEKRGRFEAAARTIELIDLPGIYSLTPRSPDEQVATDVLAGRQAGVPEADVVVVLADATAIERSCYLVSQVLDRGLPVVVAVTLGDIARERGIEIALDRLASRLGCFVVGVVAPRGEGLDRLTEAILLAADAPPPPAPQLPSIQIPAGPRSPAAREAIARYA